MNQADIEALTKGIAPVMRAAIGNALQPVIHRLVALESREPEKGEPGKDGDPGKDGRNGFELEDFDIKRGEDARTLILCFEGKEQGYEYEVTFPFPIYCGIFKEGDRYVPGDLVTWGGCLWHCDKETTEKPGATDWTLAVKKGRDGKDAKNG